MKLQSDYKLRKFVGYIENPLTADWDVIYSHFQEKIKIDKDRFKAEMHTKTIKLCSPSMRHIISETYDDDLQTFRYSMHPVSSVYAKALYAVNP